jgi:hypothetical protein
MVLQDLLDANPVSVKDINLSEYDVVVHDEGGNYHNVSSLSYEYDSDGEKRLVLHI